MDFRKMQALVWTPLFVFFAFIPGSTLNAIESPALTAAGTATSTSTAAAAAVAPIGTTTAETIGERAQSLLSASIDDKTFLKTQSITQPAASASAKATATRTIAKGRGAAAASISITSAHYTTIAAGSLVRATTNVNHSIAAPPTTVPIRTAARSDETDPHPAIVVYATITTTTTTLPAISATTIGQVTKAATESSATPTAAAWAAVAANGANTENIIINDGGNDAAAIFYTPLQHGGYNRKRNNNVHDEAEIGDRQVDALQQRWTQHTRQVLRPVAVATAANNVTAATTAATATTTTTTGTRTASAAVSLPTADIDSNSLDAMNRPSTWSAQHYDPSGDAANAGGASSTMTAAVTTTASVSTAAATTRRRLAATTTLKPPPTIDDYQTITSQAGTHAYLPCNVKQLVKKPISWLRVRDGHILTVDQTTFIADQRFQSIFTTNPERWSLQIKYVQLKDAGTYECQVSTEPKASAIVSLHIVEPRTELIGESTRHVKAGSEVKLHCIISQALEPPLFINWFYNQKQIYLHNRKGWRTEIERIDLPPPTPPTSTSTTSTSTTTTTTTTTTTSSMRPELATSVLPEAIVLGSGTPSTMSLPFAHDGSAGTGAVAVAVASLGASTTREVISKTTTTTAAAVASTTTAATTTTAAAARTTTSMAANDVKQITTASLIIPAVLKQDSGNYTCSPSNSAPRTVVLHVLNGEYSASAITSGGVGRRHSLSLGLQWHSMPAMLTLLWIIRFLYAQASAPWCRRSCGRRHMRARPGTSVDSSARVWCCCGGGRLAASTTPRTGTLSSRSGNVKSTISTAEMGEKT